MNKCIYCGIETWNKEYCDDCYSSIKEEERNEDKMHWLWKSILFQK